jgi:hypothetical protein
MWWSFKEHRLVPTGTFRDMMEANGFQTLFSLHSGRDRAIEMKNLLSRFIGLSQLLIAAFALSSTALAGAPLPKTTQDPVLGLKYEISTSSFQALATVVKTACTGLTNERWDRMLWVFAEVDEGTRRYYVLGGFYLRRDKPGVAPHPEPDPIGAVVELQDGRCTLIGPAREVFDSRPEELAAATLDSLAADLVDKYVRSFGGKAAFKKALAKQRIDIARLRNPLREAIIRGLRNVP